MRGVKSALAHRRAARQDDRVGACQRVAKECLHLGGVVRRGWAVPHVGAHCLQRTSQGPAIGITDLPGRRVRTGVYELVAPREHGDDRLAENRDRGDAERRQHSQLGAADAPAALQDLLAGEHVRPRGHERVAGRHVRRNLNRLPVYAHVLERNDRIGRRRDHAAGRDPQRRPRREHAGPRPPHRDLSGDPQPSRRLLRANCEAIHRGPRRCRIRGVGHDGLCQYAAVCALELNDIRSAASANSRERDTA